MPNAMVTVVAPLALDRLKATEDTIDAMGNPAKDAIRSSLDVLDQSTGMGTHFASLHAIRSPDARHAWIAFEFSADGTEQQALARIVSAIGEHIRPVFMNASDWRDGGDLLDYLSRHQVTTDNGWFSNPGVLFAGTPGMTVGRIRSEAHLAAEVRTLVDQQCALWNAHPPWDALRRLEDVRAQLKAKPEYAAALTTGTAEPPFKQPAIVNFVALLIWSFAKTYLWPLAIVLLISTLVGGALFACSDPPQAPRLFAAVVGARAGALIWGLLIGFWGAFWVLLVLLAIAAVATYVLLRNAEARDSLEERSPDTKILNEMFGRENRCAQNHMISVTRRKPGWVRWFTARLAFWAIGEFAANFYRPGFLSDIGTIHFARWVTVPHSRDLLFFSNYDASWESYLEDFITRAHAGITVIWSNCVGFPRTENLIQLGATDGERFKRYARHSMVPTRFWYSAYPMITTTNIRTNAEIRRGLSGVMTEDEATNWLALFGSAPRPPSKLVTSEIQSLVFGGLNFLPHGTCLLFQLPEDTRAARQWLSSIKGCITFDDGWRVRGMDSGVILGLGASGLGRLGLPPESLETFPFAFRCGMTTQARTRILGDLGTSAPDQWAWGGSTQPHVVLLVYGKSAHEVARLEGVLGAAAASAGMSAPHRIPLKALPPKGESKTEPFGFTDGISQPIIRGTYKSYRNGDPIHLVEPGEFILGYPDNRGNIPPGPTLPATADPTNRLPLIGARDDFARTQVENDRDVGRNGTFLVIRQLEQDVPAFEEYCRTESSRLQGRLPPPYAITPDFIAAKLIGRWRDGASLVRHPYQSPTAAAKSGLAPMALVRPTSKPASATPIERPSRSAGKPDELDNDFLFGAEDPEALRCPFGAHIRRANPRDSFDPGSQDQIEITNRHRIIRVGREYVANANEKPGLLFMCLNGDIERQFELIQQTWLKSRSFQDLACEKDPVLGDGETDACSFTIPSRQGPLMLKPMPAFVQTRGGGYFFIPGKRLIDYLSD
jgi:deferrochelatase/peroxidase EfeB